MVMSETRVSRELILEKAAKIFARKGLTATTVREIGDAVGVFSGSLYHYFDSKDAILAEILAQYLDTITSRYAEIVAQAKPPAESLHDLIQGSLEVAEQQPDASTIYQNESHYLREQTQFDHVQQATLRIQETWIAVIEQGASEGSFRDDIPPRTFYRLIRDAMWLSVRWHHPSDAYSTEQLANDITSIFLDGFSASHRGRRSRASRSGSSRPST
jgi:AcrR family transcriptional regulator